jgi:dihydrolipoamide dehydrogenase
VDEQCRTGLPNVYAVGDVVRGPMLGTRAWTGVMVAERTPPGWFRQSRHHPRVIYTAPEIAWWQVSSS